MEKKNISDEESRIKEIISREYKSFREEERLSSIPQTLYEKTARSAGKLFGIEPDDKTKKKMQEAIDFSHIRATPKDVASLTILVAFAICFPTVILMITKQ